MYKFKKGDLIKYFIIALIIFSSTVLAQWSTDPNENNIVAWDVLMPLIVSDMQNGIIVAGQTDFAFPVIYAQRMSVDGKRLWPGDAGIRISESLDERWMLHFGNRDTNFVISDCSGGIISLLKMHAI